LKKTLTDQLGTAHTFETSPQRIISLVPSQTELLYDLGQEAKIIGITKFCVHPYHFRSTKSCWRYQKVHYEKSVCLNPILSFAIRKKIQEIVERLSEICPVWVTNIITIEDNFQIISDFGQLLTVEPKRRNGMINWLMP
jgi:ABC-type Fe3+-hydroxamate transport system substrate-binding protein